MPFPRTNGSFGYWAESQLDKNVNNWLRQTSHKLRSIRKQVPFPATRRYRRPQEKLSKCVLLITGRLHAQNIPTGAAISTQVPSRWLGLTRNFKWMLEESSAETRNRRYKRAWEQFESAAQYFFAIKSAPGECLAPIGTGALLEWVKQETTVFKSRLFSVGFVLIQTKIETQKQWILVRNVRYPR